MINSRSAFSAALIAGMLVAAPHAALAKHEGGPSHAASKATPTPAPSPEATMEPASSAIPRLEAKLKASPDDRDTMTQLAAYYMEANRPDLALPLTERLLSSGVKSAQVFYIDGIADAQLGHEQEAIDSLEHASDLEPTNEQVLFALTDLYSRFGRLNDAERVAKRATVFNASDEHAFMNYGLVLLQEHRFDDSRAQLEQAAKLAPKDAAPLILEARTFEGQNAGALALQTLDRAVALDPKNFEALVAKARLQATQHDVKGAIATYETALPLAENDQERVALLDQEAGVYLSAKMTSDAENAIKRSISAYPSIPAAHLAYGDFFLAQHQLSRAEAEWKLALGSHDDNRDALFRLGEYYEQTDKPQQAIAEYKRAIEINQNDAQAYAQLGQAYGSAGSYDKAHDAYRHSFELVHTPQALAGLGASDYQLRNYKEGSLAFDAIDHNAPDFLKANPQLLYVMGKLYTGNHERSKAKSAYERFLAYVKPGSPMQSQVKKLIAGLNP